MCQLFNKMKQVNKIAIKMTEKKSKINGDKEREIDEDYFCS